MKFGILVAGALGVAPAALAQANDCTKLNAIVAAAPGAFEEIKDEEVDDGLFQSLVQFGDHGECVIDEAEGGALFCSWIYKAKAEGEAQSLALLENAKFCLSDGWKWTDIAGLKSVDDVPIREGYAMNGTGQNKGTRIRIYLEGEPAAQVRQVWIEAFRP